MRAIAAPSDPELRELWDSIETARLHGQSSFVGMLADRGALQDGLSVEEARDGLWTLTSLAVFDKLAGSRGWSVERHERWLPDGTPTLGQVTPAVALRF